VLTKGAAAVLVCSAAMFSGCGGNDATSSHDMPFAHATATGNHAEAQATGRTERFDKLTLHVAAAPDQRVGGSWSIACRIGDGEMSAHDGGTFTGRTPLTVQMRPAASPVPAACTAVASAKLSGSGRVTLQLLGA
jgi:hypothetical protein